MFKRTFMPVFILIAFFTAWGQQVGLDVIIRDFDAPANSLSERQAAGYAGYYGFQEFDYSKGNNRECNPDGATKGMVQQKLFYDIGGCGEDIVGNAGDPDYIRYRYCSRPMPVSPAPAKMCYGEHLDTWYTNGSYTKVINEILTLTRNRDGLYEIDTVGYFPLDKYPDSETFGRQNRDDKNDRHNFGFTVAGSAEFRYVSANNDKFTFKGDDDMWMFIDGELVMDLGGVHPKLADSVSINNVANMRGWQDGSIHSLNFFYAERQTVESNLMLRFRLTGL